MSARKIAQKMKTGQHLSMEDLKFIRQALRLATKRFVIFKEDDEYGGFHYTFDESNDAYRFETLAQAIKVLGAEFVDRRNRDSKIIVDMLTNEQVYHSDEWLAENPKRPKYASKEEMLSAGLINQEEYDLLSDVDFFNIIHMVNEPDARRNLMEFMRRHKKYLGNIDEMCNNVSLDMQVQHALRTGQITLSQANQLACLPKSEQLEPLEIMRSGGRVTLHGY